MAPYVFVPGVAGLEGHRTGFGLVVGKIARELSRDHDLAVLTLRPNQGDVVGPPRVLPLRPNVWRLIASLESAQLAGNYLRLALRSERLWPGRAKAFVKLSLGKQIETQLRANGPEVLNLQGLGTDSLALVRAAIATRIPVVLSLHGLGFREFAEADAPVHEELYRQSVRLVFGAGGAITTINTASAVVLREWCVDLRGGLIETIGHGIDLPDRAPALGVAPRQESRRRFLTVGSICERKSQMLLLEAVRALPPEFRAQCEFRIAGGGPGLAALTTRCRELALEGSVTILGEIDDAELQREYEGADHVVLPSREEGFGLPIIEAAAHGKSCLFYSGIQSAADLHRAGVNQMFTSRSPEALAAAFVALDRAAWDGMAIRAYAREWSWPEVRAKYTRVLRYAADHYRAPALGVVDALIARIARWPR